MPSMNYCLLENTYGDLELAYDKVARVSNGEISLEDLGEQERLYLCKLLELCEEICDDFGELRDIVRAYEDDE